MVKIWIDNFFNNYKGNDMMKVSVTQTDTMGGEANYSWANRYEFAIHRMGISAQILIPVQNRFTPCVRCNLSRLGIG